jgi:hypothetical protein
MSNLINPKPRFGYNPATGQIYDYVAQKDLTPSSEIYSALDGTWNLVTVRDAILAGQTIEAGHLSVKSPTPPAAGKAQSPKPAVALPGAPVAPTTTSPKHGQPSTINSDPHATTGGLSAEQVTALKLSPLQMAALGVTPIQLTATGVTPMQVTLWHLTPARADALSLTAEQRAVLLP